MTKAKFIYSNQLFQTFEISGHAEYADEGLDIVCAGISATVINSLNLIISSLKIYIPINFVNIILVSLFDFFALACLIVFSFTV